MTIKCHSCSDEAAPGKSRCSDCLDRSRRVSASYRSRHPHRVADNLSRAYAKRREDNICGCGSEVVSGKTRCSDCLNVHLERTAVRRSVRQKSGLCKECGVVSDGPYCRGCLDKQIARNRALKAEVVAAYGGKCACCGEGQILFLQIDHINGGGKKDRDAGLFSATWYRWLKNNGYPKDYQLLCANCNWGKHINGGVCPHRVAEG